MTFRSLALRLAAASALGLALTAHAQIARPPSAPPPSSPAGGEQSEAHDGTPAAAPAAAPGPEAPGGLYGFTPEHAALERTLEQRFDTQIRPEELAGWLERMASAPNQVGGPHDRENAEFVLSQFKAWGWDAHIETFQVLYPTPVQESLELLGPTPYRARLLEPPVPGDRTSEAAGQLPPYVAYQGDGDVTAELVYVNYGMPEDYAALARMGVDVRGKIVIARYGQGWRGLKPKLAQEHGAAGCLIYSDPADDGYATDDVYPKGAQRPADGVQRGSVQDMTTYPGDPLTPGIAATPDAKRLTRETAPTILKIPALPISYGDAKPLLEALGGQTVPKGWRGALPITYHPGPGPARVHLVVKSDWSLKPIYDVVATMKGAALPDQWIVRGNHHDGWVFGASDPLSGHSAMLAEAKAIGALVKSGWRPKRTLVYTSWDAEEPGLVGSTEWVEAHADALQKHAVLYVNSDNIDRGFLHAGGSQALQHLVNEVARDVPDPETGAPLRERQRARLEVASLEGGERERRLAAVAARGGDLPIEALGSGSDYSAFVQHLGVASLDIGFGGEGESGGVYHSAYDSWDHYRRFGDPGEAYGAALAKTVGRVVLRAADADAAPMRFSDTAGAFGEYVEELKRLVRTRREHAGELDRLLDGPAFRLAADPTKPTAAPARPAPVAAVDFTALDRAVARLKTAARAFDAAYAAEGPALPAARRLELDQLLDGMEQRLLEPAGLPDRPWYRNLAYAPGVLTGYGAKTLPGVREAIEADRYAVAARYAQLTAAAFDRYSDGLDQGSHLLAGR